MASNTVIFAVLAFVAVLSSVECACKDTSTNCAAWKANGFCTNPAYTDAHRSQYCQKTCQLCPIVGNPTGCFDYSPSCSNWVANGYCQHTFYSPLQKATTCQFSCNLCSPLTTCPPGSSGPCDPRMKCQNAGDVCTNEGCCPASLAAFAPPGGK